VVDVRIGVYGKGVGKSSVKEARTSGISSGYGARSTTKTQEIGRKHVRS
jgi:hypothetical protein